MQECVWKFAKLLTRRIGKDDGRYLCGAVLDGELFVPRLDLRLELPQWCHNDVNQDELALDELIKLVLTQYFLVELRRGEGVKIKASAPPQAVL